MKKLLFLFSLLFSLVSYSQEERGLKKIPDTVPVTIDSLYREDQFYVGFSFNLVTERPSTISQESFSGGFHAGFIRDFPLNKRRNIGIGIGAGWSINSYGQDLFIGKNANGKTIFESLADNSKYQTNRFTTQLVEMPIEFRWRSSTPATYKFWRVYSGFRLGYMYHFRSNYKSNTQQVIVNDLSELNRFRIGTTFTFGYNTFNFQFYYALNPFFDNAEVDGENFGISTLKIGLTFYIL